MTSFGRSDGLPGSGNPRVESGSSEGDVGKQHALCAKVHQRPKSRHGSRLSLDLFRLPRGSRPSAKVLRLARPSRPKCRGGLVK